MRTILLLITSSALLIAQQADVAGLVLDATTHQPLAGAHITLRPVSKDPNHYGAISQQDGSFSLTGVKPGKYEMSGERNGYIHLPHPPISLKAGSASLSIALTRQSLISGHVLDDFGDPVQHVEVSATPVTGILSPDSFPGLRFKTDEQGWFRLRVPPGKYHVKAEPAARTVQRQEIRNDGQSPLAAGAAYASVVDVAPGQEASGIDLRLTRTHGLSIRGIVVGGTAAGEMLVLRNAENIRLIQVGLEGRFTAAGLDSGVYQLGTSGMLGDRPVRSAQVQVRLETADIDGVELRMFPAETVSGVVELEKGKLPADAMTVRLTPALGRGDDHRCQVASDGTFQIPDVFPGSYRIEVLSMPENAYVKSPAAALDLPGPALHITISPNGGLIEGRILPEGSAATVVLAPTGGTVEENNMKLAEDDGTFRFSGLRPGRYRLLAVDPTQEWKDLLVKAPEFEIHEGDRIRRELKVGNDEK